MWLPHAPLRPPTPAPSPHHHHIPPAPLKTPQVRSNLHVVLCMSPVGDAFRVRCRMFPALTACTAIDWFHPWPTAALISVAMRFLEDVDLGADAVRPPSNLCCGHPPCNALHRCTPCTLHAVHPARPAPFGLATLHLTAEGGNCARTPTTAPRQPFPPRTLP